MTARRHPGYHRRRDMRLWSEDQARQDAQRQRDFMQRYVQIARGVVLGQQLLAADHFDAASDADGQAPLLRTGLH